MQWRMAATHSVRVPLIHVCGGPWLLHRRRVLGIGSDGHTDHADLGKLAVQTQHADIHQHHIGLQLGDLLERQLAVGASPTTRKSGSWPSNAASSSTISRRMAVLLDTMGAFGMSVLSGMKSTAQKSARSSGAGTPGIARKHSSLIGVAWLHRRSNRHHRLGLLDVCGK
jgi:hypothetical protein